MALLPNMNQLFSGKADLSQPAALAPVAKDQPVGLDGPMLGTFDDQELLDLWDGIKKESLSDRYVFERQWQHHILYLLGRQWIEYFGRDGGWKDRRLAQWLPRPVTNICKETLITIRAMFASIKLGVNIRPNGTDPQDVAAAATADSLAPILHEAHHMDDNLNEFDFWLIACGNAFLHSFVDYDLKHGTVDDPSETCAACGVMAQSSEIADAGNVCPSCGQNAGFTPAVDETGQPILNSKPKGQPTTVVLSPLEVAFPNDYARFRDLPYIIRLRWRTRRYCEDNPAYAALKDKLTWQKSPTDLSLALYKSLSRQNDMGIGPSWTTLGGSGNANDEGVAEYEVWYKPCNAYPDGLVFRVLGEQAPQIVHLEDTEALPGPFPYTDGSGKPYLPFAHSAYDQVGGRVLGSGPMDLISEKQDQINQLDSHMMLTSQRMANPVWIYPKGAGISQITGIPGLMVEWDPLTVNGMGEPKRIDGIGPHSSLFALREQYKKEVEELVGTFDVIKGAQPTGVDAFSALQLLVERSQARFASVFAARGDAYRYWVQMALELEREFGPDERTRAVLSADRMWTFETYKRANLMGSMNAVVEDGSSSPKTSLGMRAALDHAVQLKIIDMQDPDQKYEGLKLMGLQRMVPTLDVHIQAALQKQQAFEDWVKHPQNIQDALLKTQQQVAQYQQTIQEMPPPMGAPVPPAPSALNNTPLKWKPWYNPVIHRQEFVKWMNSDRMRQLLLQQPGIEPLLDQASAELDQAALTQAMQTQAAAAPAPPGQQPLQGAGRAMTNSNAEGKSGGNVPAAVGQASGPQKGA